MWSLIIAGSIVITSLTVATLITAKLHGVSWEKAFEKVWCEVKNMLGLTAPTPTTPSYAPEQDVEMIQRVVDAVSKHSALDSDSTWQMVDNSCGFPVINVQIVPLNDTALEIAAHAAATLAQNAAVARGFRPDVETAVIPLEHGAFAIQIGIATTPAQTVALANHRHRENMKAVLNAGGGNHEIIDHELEQELDKIGGDCNA